YRRQTLLEFLERTGQVLAERRAGQKLHQRPAEVQRAQLRQREARVHQALERLPIETPGAPGVSLALFEGKAGLLQLGEVATNRSRSDAEPIGQLLDGQAVSGGFRLLQQLPLADDFLSTGSFQGNPCNGPFLSRLRAIVGAHWRRRPWRCRW